MMASMFIPGAIPVMRRWSRSARSCIKARPDSENQDCKKWKAPVPTRIGASFVSALPLSATFEIGFAPLGKSAHAFLRVLGIERRLIGRQLAAAQQIERVLEV